MRQCSNYQIKKLILLLTFLVSGYSSKSQYSKSIDSSIVVDISGLDSNLQAKFFRIYNNLFSEKLYRRIDSLEYSSVIIEAQFIDTTLYLDEYYYTNVNDRFPSLIYMNNERNTNYYAISKDYDKQKLVTKIVSIKKTQTLNYLKKQIIYHGCMKNPNWKLRKDRKEQLLKTFQIQIYIDSKNGIIKTSLQTPPKNPSFKIKTRGSGF